MIRLLTLYTHVVTAMTTRLQAFTARNLALADEIRTVNREDAERPIENMPFAERHTRIVKHRTVYAIIAAAYLSVYFGFVVGAIIAGFGVAYLVNLAVIS